MQNNKIVDISRRGVKIPNRQPINRPNPNLKPMSRPRQLNNQPQNTLKEIVKKPITHTIKNARKIGHNMDIAYSKKISKFTPPSTPAKPNSTKPLQKINLPQHPISRKLQSIQSAQSAKNTPKTAQQIKQEAIAEALSQISTKQADEKTNSQKKLKIFRFISIILVSAIIIAAGFFIYFNTPSLTIGIANARAGVDASFPEYIPVGYKVNGPVSSKDNQVVISFSGNNATYNLTQSKSSWDSTAVKNMVAKSSNNEFITTEDKGLTIYSYNGNASWVNGGILYSIDGNAPLTSDQIRRIATSL